MRALVVIAAILITTPALAQIDAPEKSSPLDSAIDRGLDFLAKDALAWKAEHNCVSCHHAALIAWSLREAKQNGRRVDESVLAEMTKWVAESGDGKTSLPRPANIPKALNAKAVWFALALEADSKPDPEAQAGLKRFLETVKGDQTEGGNWASWPETRAPIFGHSDEGMTVLATLALLPAADGGDDSAILARDKGVRWLAESKSDDEAQSTAVRLLIWQRLKRPAEEIESLVRHIEKRQNADGGWSQNSDLASDAWATGQTLYALAHTKSDGAKPMIARGQEFLIKSQRPDGSWVMKSRPTKPGDEGAKNLMPITGAGSAWGVLGLVRSR